MYIHDENNISKYFLSFGLEYYVLPSTFEIVTRT
jgi:hypothetical protein